MSRNTRSRPSARFRSTPRLVLLRLNTGKKPAPAAFSRRVLSPSSGSTLTTSAPRSASTSPQVGPITMCANSTTRTPSSGSTEPLGQPGQRHVAVHGLLRNGGDHELARFHELFKIHAGRRAHALEHEDEVLGDHVAARPRREGAAAQAAHGTVEMAHAFLGNFALHGAAERGGDAGFYFRTVLAAHLHALADLVDHLLGRHAHVGEAVRAR